MLRLLVPVLRTPSLELLSASGLYEVVRTESEHYWNWHFQLSLYVVPSDERPIVIPYHRCEGMIEATVHLLAPRAMLPLERLRFYVSGGSQGTAFFNTPYELLIRGPGQVELGVEGATEPLTEHAANHPLLVHLTLHSVGGAAPNTVRLELTPVSGVPMTWRL